MKEVPRIKGSAVSPEGEQATRVATQESLLGIDRALRDPIGVFIDSLEGDGAMAADISVPDVSFLSPQERAESLWAIYKDVREDLRKSREKEAAQTDEEDDDLQMNIALMKALYNDPETLDAYKEGYTRHQAERRNINGDFETYQTLRKDLLNAESAFDASAKNMFGKRGKGIREIDTLLFESNRREVDRRRDALERLLERNPELGALAEHETLVRYAKELRETGFIWSASRRILLEEIETAAISGKPLLLSGESGTGKTRIVEEAARVLTGRLANETPGKDVRFQDLIAKRDIAPDGTTYYRFQEIGEAATGKETTLDSEAQHDGRVVADDEFNLLSPSEQTERMARIAAWSPGKKVRMPVTNTDEQIGSRFLYCAMVNLASERYDRKKIPPEVLRKFAKVDVDYPPQTSENPEIYELMLASLLDDHGRVRAAKEELSPFFEEREEVRQLIRNGHEVKGTLRIRELKDTIEENGIEVPAGGFLWRFAGALHELNNSFSHRPTVLSHKGEGQYLKDFVLDMGTVIGWLREYGTTTRNQSLEDFVIGKLKDQFLGKSAYSEEDRLLVKEFLQHFDIDVNKEDGAQEKAEFKILTPVEVGLLSPRVKYERVVSEEPAPTEGYVINAQGERVEYNIVPYKNEGVSLAPGDIIDDPLSTGRKREYLGTSKEGGEPIFRSHQERRRAPEQRGGVSMEKAQEIFGEEFLGPEAVKKAFGFEVRDVPLIPFSVEDLERANKLGQFLVLRVDTMPSGDKLTMKKMKELADAKLSVSGKGKLLHSGDDPNSWYKNEAFHTTETPRLGWALVDNDLIPDTKNKNYLEQTDVLVEGIGDRLFKDTVVPNEYKEAIKEFEDAREEIKGLMSSDWQEASRRLAGLKINQLTRQNMSEVTYDSIVKFLNNNERLLESPYTWTISRSSDGFLVYFGFFGSRGAGVGRGWPGDASALLGVLSSRRS
jgi:hypothetical protein